MRMRVEWNVDESWAKRRWELSEMRMRVEWNAHFRSRRDGCKTGHRIWVDAEGCRVGARGFEKTRFHVTDPRFLELEKLGNQISLTSTPWYHITESSHHHNDQTTTLRHRRVETRSIWYMCHLRVIVWTREWHMYQTQMILMTKVVHMSPWIHALNQRMTYVQCSSWPRDPNLVHVSPQSSAGGPSSYICNSLVQK